LRSPGTSQSQEVSAGKTKDYKEQESF